MFTNSNFSNVLQVINNDYEVGCFGVSITLDDGYKAELKIALPNLSISINIYLFLITSNCAYNKYYP